MHHSQHHPALMVVVKVISSIQYRAVLWALSAVNQDWHAVMVLQMSQTRGMQQGPSCTFSVISSRYGDWCRRASIVSSFWDSGTTAMPTTLLQFQLTFMACKHTFKLL